MSDPNADLTAEEEKTLVELQARDKKGQFVRKPAVVTTPPPVIPTTPPATPPPETAVDPYVEKFAAKLKAELGDKYTAKFDALEVKQRITAMELVIETINGVKAPIIKTGEGESAGTPPPEVSTKPKTFLEIQQEAGFGRKLRDKGSYKAMAEEFYK